VPGADGEQGAGEGACLFAGVAILDVAEHDVFSVGHDRAVFDPNAGPALDVLQRRQLTGLVDGGLGGVGALFGDGGAFALRGGIGPGGGEFLMKDLKPALVAALGGGQVGAGLVAFGDQALSGLPRGLNVAFGLTLGVAELLLDAREAAGEVLDGGGVLSVLPVRGRQVGVGRLQPPIPFGEFGA
jgi:hypothetical protein